MNPNQRRALAPATRHHADRTSKHSYRLPPQRCVLWIPEACGYVQSFNANGFRVVEAPELAQVYVEDEATSAAITFQEITGLRVAIRTAYCQHH